MIQIGCWILIGGFAASYLMLLVHHRSYKWETPFLVWAERLYRMPVLVTPIQVIRKIMAGLEGEQQSVPLTKIFLARVLRMLSISTIVGALFVLVLDGDQWTAFCICIFIVLIPFVMFKNIQNKWIHKQQCIRLELPIVLSKLLMLIEAGETLQRALQFTVPQHRKDHPLYTELSRILHRLKQQVPLLQALEECSQRCPVKEMRWFIQALSLNYRRGGEQLSQTLRELSERLWSERQATARILGEEASSKLLFPMILLFVAVLIVVATPAVMWLGL